MIGLDRSKIRLFNIFFVPLLSFVWLYSILYLSNVESPYRVSTVLPMIYIMGYVFLFVVRKKEVYDIHLIIVLLFFIKLFVLPELVVLTGTFDISRMNPELLYNIDDSVLLQSLEWVTVVCCLCIMGRRGPGIDYFERKWDIVTSKKIWRLVLGCSIVVILAMVVFPSLTYKYRPIFFGDEAEEILWKQRSIVAVATINSIIYYPLNWLIAGTRLSFFYFLTIKIWQKRENQSDFISIILSISAIILGLVLIVPDDVSASIIAATCLVVMLTKLYPNHRKIIVNMLTITALLFFVYVFFGKAFLNGSELLGSLLLLTRRLNAYFSGFINMAASMNMKALDKFAYFSGDLLRSIPVIKGFFVTMPTTTELFNSVLGYDTIYNSQIIPLAGQAYFYLNFLGVIMVPAVVIRTCMYFYRKMLYSASTYEFFIYCFFSLLSAIGLVMYDMFLILYLLLLYAPLYLIGFFVKRGEKNESVNLS